MNFSDKRWNKPVNLKNLLAIPEGMENFVQDYKINVFDIAFLPDETINKFKSTFKHVAHFFKYMWFPDIYQPLGEENEHLEAFLDFLEVFTTDRQYAEIKDGLLEMQREGDVVTMCSVVEKFKNDGIKQGIERGIEQEQKQIILNMYEAGCDAETISGLTKISIETVKSVLKDV